jgi:hypothetical protein
MLAPSGLPPTSELEKAEDLYAPSLASQGSTDLIANMPCGPWVEPQSVAERYPILIDQPCEASALRGVWLTDIGRLSFTLFIDPSDQTHDSGFAFVDQSENLINVTSVLTARGSQPNSAAANLQGPKMRRYTLEVAEEPIAPPLTRQRLHPKHMGLRVVPA